MKSYLFPDINVWIALTYTKHVHYENACQWFVGLPQDAQLYFCRFTQIGFLRLLTTSAVMGDQVLSQARAWNVYDDWLREGGASFMEEPAAIETAFRSLTQTRRVAPKDWADSYLSAFATAADLRLVTLDQGFQGRGERFLILRP